MDDETDAPEWKTRKCNVCDKGFTKQSWLNRHTPHEKDCRRWGRDGCTCDFVTHPGCCWECEPQKVARYWDLQAVKQAVAEMEKPAQAGESETSNG